MATTPSTAASGPYTAPTYEMIQDKLELVGSITASIQEADQTAASRQALREKAAQHITRLSTLIAQQ